MIYEHVLQGCAPVPLASYLKALGVFRLVAEQADPDARGHWHKERFVLRTRLSVDELVRFFTGTYEPSPIISPWSGRAGFLEGEEEKPDKESSRAGAQLVRSYQSAAARFHNLRTAVQAYGSIGVVNQLDSARTEVKRLESQKKASGLTEAESIHLREVSMTQKLCKAAVVVSLRSGAPEAAVDWFYGVSASSGQAIR